MSDEKEFLESRMQSSNREAQPMSTTRLSFGDLWTKNQRDFLRHNPLSVHDLSTLLKDVASGEIRFPRLSQAQAAYLLADLFWMSLVQVAQVRRYLAGECEISLEDLRTEEGVNKVRACLLKSKLLKEKDVENLVTRIKGITSSEEFEAFPQSALLRDHRNLGPVFSVNPIREIGQKHVFVGQLVSQETSAPLPSLRIRAIDVSDNAKPLGASVSDGAGLFALFLPTPEEFTSKGKEVERQCNLRLQIYDEQSKEVHKTKFREMLPQRKPLKIRVPSVEKNIPAPPTLTELAETLGFAFPRELIEELHQQGIHNLDDIRRIGGLHRLEGLSVTEYEAMIEELDAHADLFNLSFDLKANASLIKKGFLNTQAIARSSLTNFINTVRDELGEIRAVTLHRMARAQIDFLNNVLTGARADWANYRKPPFFSSDVQSSSPGSPGSLEPPQPTAPSPTSPAASGESSSSSDISGNPAGTTDSGELFEDKCECKDCDAAVSPRAYLADLLDYAIRNISVRNPESGSGSRNINLEELTSLLHQPFGELPASCEAVNVQVRQARICIETLRSYLKKYVEELSEEYRSAWVDACFTRLKEREQAYNLVAYSTLLHGIGTSYTEIRLIGTSDDEQKKALADRLGIPSDLMRELVLNPDANPRDPQALTEQNLERIFGLADTRRHPLSGGAKMGDHRRGPISHFDLVGVVWNLNTDTSGIIYASLEWTSTSDLQVRLFKDRAKTQKVASGQLASTPGTVTLTEENDSGLSGSLDIELIEYPGDFLNLEIAAIPDLLTCDQGQITRWQFDNVQWNWNTDENGLIYLTLEKQIVNVYRDRSRSDLVARGIRTDLKGTVVLSEIGDSGLTGEVEIDYVAESSAIEIAVIPLFLAGRLKYLHQVWEAQDWPGDLPQGGYPLIDPDVIGPDDFRTTFARGGPGSPAGTFDLWIRRRQWVDKAMLELVSLTKNGFGKPSPDFDSILSRMKQNLTYGGETHGSPWPSTFSLNDLETLYKDLRRGESVAEKINTIETALHLTVDSFTRLMELYNKDQQFCADPRKEKVTGEEWEEVYSILVQAQKHSLFYVWRVEEGDMGIVDEFGPKHFWMSMREPKQGEWPDNPPLQRPAIDPDLVAEEELQQSPAGKNAIRLRQARKAQLDQIYERLQATCEDLGFEAMLKVALGHPNAGDNLPYDLDTLTHELNDTDSHIVEGARQKITEGLFMTEENFGFLIDIRAKVTDGTTNPTEAEWAELYKILSRAQKLKREYPGWLIEEKAPLVDPDSVKLEELADPTAGALATRLWQARRAQLDQIYERLQVTCEDLSFEAMLKVALGHPNAGDNLPYDLSTLNDDLGTGNAITVTTAIRAITEELFMTLDDFNRLMILRAKYLGNDAANKPTTEEWTELFTILQQAQKTKRETPNWIEQEKSLGITYWTVLKAKLPRWRAPLEARQEWQQALQIRCQPPIIDPDLVGIGDLRNWASGDPAADVLEHRSDGIKNRLDAIASNQADYSSAVGIGPPYALDKLLIETVFDRSTRSAVKDYLQALGEASSLGTILWYVFSNLELSPDELQPLIDLHAILEGGSPDSKSKVKKTIKESLFLAVEQFERLMIIIESGHIDDHLDQVFDILTQAFLVSAVMGLDDNSKEGYDIQPRLEQFSLSGAAFSYLVEIRHLLASDAPVQPDEWANIYSIFVQVEKRRNTAMWRAEEKALNIILSPDFFKLPDLELPELAILEPTSWRATYGERREWQRKLESRIEQERTTITSMREIISTTEEAHLPTLRDALILATVIEQDGRSDQGLALEEQSSWLTNRLIIDAKAGGCQTTTRISQAITTMQKLLWQMRTGQFKGVLLEPNVDLTLVAENFDEEWKWMGSYATWRAALFVFMYPENILIPNLRKQRWQTPAFRELVQSIGSNPRVTSEEACEAAKTYADYFRDICNLRIQATCQARVHVSNAGCANRGGQVEGYRDLFFMFALSEKTNNLYWSTYDPLEGSEPYSGEDDTGQTFWKPLSLESYQCLKVLGAVPYRVETGGRFVLLFVHVQTEEGQKLVLRRFDLEKGLDLELGNPAQWEEDVVELCLPDDAGSLTPVLGMQTDEQFSPDVLIQDADWRTVYTNRLDKHAKGWQSDWMEWFPRPTVFYGFVYNLDGSPAVGALVKVYSDEASNSTYTDSQGYYKIIDMVLTENQTVKVLAWKDDYVYWGHQIQVTVPTVIQVDVHMKVIPPGSGLSWPEPTPPLTPTSPPPALSGGFAKRKALSMVRLTVDRVIVFLLNEETNGFEFVCGNTKRRFNESSFSPNMFGRGSYEDWQGVYPYFTVEGYYHYPHVGVYWFNEEDWHPWHLMIVFGERDDELIGGCWIEKIMATTSGFTEPGMFVAPHNSQYAGDQTAGNVPRMYAYNRKYYDLRNYPPEIMNENYKGEFILHPEDNPTQIQPKYFPALFANAITPLRKGIKLYEVIGRNRTEIFDATHQAWIYSGTSNRSNQIYIEEAYYSVPISIALQLQRSKQYTAALDWFRTAYDYGSDQKIAYYGLTRDLMNPSDSGYERLSEWLLDPLNPHAIANTRIGCYARFTVLSIISCLLDYADDEYSLDTVESVSRARSLYTTALGLLDSDLLKQSLNECDTIIGTLDIAVGSGDQTAGSQNLTLLGADCRARATVVSVKQELRKIENKRILVKLIKDIRSDFSKPGDWLKKLTKARRRIRESKIIRETRRMGSVLEQRQAGGTRTLSALMAHPLISSTASAIANTVANDTLHGITRTLSEAPNLGLQPIETLPLEEILEEYGSDDWISSTRYAFTALVSPIPSYQFCIPPNPLIMALRLRAEVNLAKIRTCRNIAGMERELEPYAAPTDTVSGLPSIGVGGQLILPGAARIQPTLYRYRILIERAKQLAQLASQMEAAMLAALEKRDVEYYNRLKAEQDIQLAKGQVHLQSLRVKEAEDGVTLAELQQERAQLQVDSLQEMIDAELNQYEQVMIDAYNVVAQARILAAFFEAGTQFGQAATEAATAGALSIPGATAMAAYVASMAMGKYMATGVAVGAETSAQIASVWASYERRKQEWEYQQKLAEQDVLIGGQGITLAKDHVHIVEQEQEIAEMQTRHAEEIKDFLANKFTNVELYDWMSNVLEGVYSFFLQQATSVAHLASNQLAFERQEMPPSFIQADYWEAPSEMGIGAIDGAGSDRRGLTGSARLLQDIYQLDQYAFETDKRKLQLVKTISLSQMAPVEFQRFRETGKMIFITPMGLFDQDFPGHYLRLIKRVRTSVVALIPPTHGIKASLSASGLSRVVIGPDVFQTVNIRRSPETVALTSPINTTGLFELEPQSEMLYPFEGIGVDTTWEFRMPRAANRFDYNTIADVLLTIEYTALESYTYRQQVVQELNSTFRGERPFSFRHDFPDQWYHLHNPDQTSTPMVVRFATRREYFPPNLREPKIEQVLLYFARSDGSMLEIPVTHLTFSEAGTTGSVGGTATTIDGSISTRKGNAGSWMAMIGKSPVGEWELAIPNTSEMKKHFKDDEVTDILFVLSYNAVTPDWPA